MKKRKFKVIFIDNSELVVHAFSEMEALYLGSAMKIIHGQSYLVDAILDVENNRFYVTDKSTIGLILKER